MRYDDITMANNTKKKLGWHFLPADMRLTNGDGRQAKVGHSLSIPKDETPRCCGIGMHASVNPSQAARFEAGPVLTRVEVTGQIHDQYDKFAGRTRKVLWAKKLTYKDVAALAKAVGHSLPYYFTAKSTDSEITSQLKNIAYSYSGGFNTWCDNLMKSDSGGTVIVAAPKPLFTAKILLSLLSNRLVRTKKEILSGLSGVYDMTPTDTWNADAFDSIVDDDSGTKIIVVDGFTPSGADGYLLRPTK